MNIPRRQFLKKTAVAGLASGFATPFLRTSVKADGPSKVSLLDYKTQLDSVLTHDDRKFLWFHAGVAPLPTRKTAEGHPSVLMTLQRHLHADDHYSGEYTMRTDDWGKTWSQPVLQKPLDWKSGPNNETLAVCDVTPGWHAKTQKVLAIGIKLRYNQAGAQLLDQPRSQENAYAVYDPKRDRWSEWAPITIPETDGKFFISGSGCPQWTVEEDGTLHVPFYFRGPKDGPYGATVMKCSFDGQQVKYQRHGTELNLNVVRGFVEPSLVKHHGIYYLTLRNDVKGYISTSRDGLTYSPPQPWLFDDGQELGSYNTQQHWLSHSDGLFLLYTRKGANNDHIIRHRAPLFMAQVDPKTLRVIRRSEKILVPERGGTYGNFRASAIDSSESWATVGEGVWSDDARRRGAKGTVFASRIIWSKPNRDAEVQI